jgi:hypothetical protein
VSHLYGTSSGAGSPSFKVDCAMLCTAEHTIIIYDIIVVFILGNVKVYHRLPASRSQVGVDHPVNDQRLVLSMRPDF